MLFTVFFAPTLQAQFPPDSLPPDSLVPRDTVDQTKRYLDAQAENNIRLPTLPRLGGDGPRPAMSRLVFERDSLDWINAETLADLIQRVPGVYLWRGGWVGRPEYPDYQGRGATSVEYYLDGLPYVALGVDSTGVDPSLFALSFLSRVEIERWPGLLRVYLYTRRHDRRATASRIGVASGDKKIARFQGALEERLKNGLGFVVAMDYLNAPTASGKSSGYANLQAWIQGSWVPSPRFGVEYQLIRTKPQRNPFIVGSGGGVDTTIGGSYNASRSDALFRAYYARRSDGLGPRVDLLYGRSGWNGEGIKDQSNQGGVVLSFRTPTFTLGGSAFNRSRFTPFDFRAQGGWAPTEFFTASAEAGYLKHDSGRRSTWIGARGSLKLPLSFEVGAAIRKGSILTTPSLWVDSAQNITDAQLLAGWQRPWAAVEFGLSRTDAFRPQSYQPFLAVPGLQPFGRINWYTVQWRLSPLKWLSFDGWYSNPINGAPDGIPPTHSISNATIRSKFWRTFPSGTFDFKLQGTMEGWSPGVIGRDSTGAAIPLPGATFFRIQLAIQLQSFILYWDRTNAQASKKAYVPGFRMPNFASTFGVRWEFRN